MQQEQSEKKKKPVKWVILGLVLVAVLGVSIYFWLKNAGYVTTDNAQLDGNISPVRASVNAYVDSIYFTDNQYVRKGDTLMRFNNTVYAARVQEAEAALENAGAGVQVSNNSAAVSSLNAEAGTKTSLSGLEQVASARANYDKADQDMRRANALLEIKGITQQQYESVKTRLLVAKASYEEAIHRQQSSLYTSLGLKASAKTEQSRAGVARTLVKQREAELIIAREDLEHTVIISPFDGIVTKRAVNKGQYVATGQTLCAVIDTHNIWVSANFKETQLKKIRPGQPVEIKVDAYPDLKLEGSVESFGGATGAKFSLLPPDNSTGNFIKITQRVPLRIRLEHFFDGNNKPTGLFIGMSVFVKVHIK
ncbi:MAG TPA: HlyD family secretion protein [Chitinophaga sp.]|uniref:HlyD family secretion protein n=1 Tax=Chitinophaga sp. TaxID=1869181 RepID=UPI002C2DB02D|nr:HlyD family secretion protein [Chitinophaga sp.]HVI45854.1 HlyD family secretion protein [Chitinophaga sp.]